MKRKIFSKLLMGAFLIASVSSFVSCKDYDDDINNLQKQIDAAALKAELTTLQSTLQAQIAAAQSAADKAQAAAQAAQNTANAAATKDALDAVKSAAEKAGADAATAIAAAANAQIAANAAQTTADNAGSAAEKAAADAAKAISDAAAAQGTASVAQTAAAAAAEAAKVAQAAGDAATANAATALADAAKAVENAATAAEAAKAALTNANSASATATEAKATAENGIAAAANAAAQAAEAIAAANAAKTAAEAAKYNDEAVRILIDKAQGSADAAAKDAKDAAEAAAAAVIASAAAGNDAAAAKEAAAKVDEAIKTATDAITEATDAKIKSAIAEAMAKVPADTSAEIEKLSGDLQTLGSTVEKLATAEGLSAAVTELEGKIEGAADAAAAAAVAAAAGTIDAAVAELYATITSVELVGSFSALDFNPDKDSQTYPLGFTTATWAGIDLDFIFGKQQWTATFGDKETESLDDDAVEKVSYKKGDDIRANRALLIRVNPVNAEFTKDQVKFINSKLETLDEIVEIGEPYRFKGMLTRGTSESGLWVIPVNVKKDVTFNKFNEITFYKSAGDWKYDKNTGDLETWRYDQKLYAVAIDNTPDMDGEESIDRYVASTYDIATEYVHYTPATVLNAYFEWTLDNADKQGTTMIGLAGYETIHNRWTNNVYNSENKPGILSKDQTNAYTVVPAAMEKKWTLWATNSNEYKAGLVAPTAAEPTKSIEKTVNGAKKYNTEDDGSDQRFGYSYLTIKNTGDNIKVELTPALKKKVEYWYISYDFELNAVESKPSEWEAWQSYQDGIDGIYTMTRGDKAIDLQINKETAQGDVIGFRIWAVNYDGSLVDPDGKAFYVKVGEEPEANVLNISANIMAVDATTGMALSYLTDEDKTYTADKNYNVSTITKVDGNKFESLASTYGSFTGSTIIYSNGTKDQTIVNGKSVRVYWALLKSDKKTVANNYKDVAYIKAGIAGSDLKNLKDGATLSNIVTYTDTRKDVNNKEKYRINISVTKQMPDDAWTKKYHFDGVITWKTDYGWDPKTNVLTTYVKPYYDLVPQGFDYLKPKFIKGTGGAADVFNWKWQAGAAAADIMSGWIDDAKWLNWDYSVNTNLANAGVRDIDDYIASVKTGTDLSLYKWVIEGAPTELTGNGEPATKDYTALWTSGTADTEVADNAIVAVKAKAVREDKTLNSKLKYTYVGISARIKAVATDGTVTWEGWDLVKNANDFKTHFADAMDLLTYGTTRTYLSYDIWQEQGTGGTLPAIKTGTNQLTDANLYIDWLGTCTGQNWVTQVQDVDPAVTNVLFQLSNTDKREAAVGTIPSQSFNPNTYSKFNATALAGALKSSNLKNFLTASISASNKVLAENKQISGSTNVNGAGIDRDRATDGITTSSNLNINRATKFAFNENYYKFDNPATATVVENAMKIELSGAITTYLKVSPNATPSNMILQKIGGVQDPHQNVTGNIKLSGYDVFGKYHEFNLPVVILYNR